MKQKRVLILGGSGFIGRHLVEDFTDIHTVLAPSHAALDLFDTAGVERYVRKETPDVIINATTIGESKGGQETTGTLTKDVIAFANLVRCRRWYDKLILLGSGAEYDKSRPVKKATEDQFGKHIPTAEYGLAKYLMGQYALTTDNIIDLRLFGIFGTYEDQYSRFISQSICRNLFGQPILIRQDCFFDYLWVKDLTKIINYFVIHKAAYRAYNVASGRAKKLSAIAKIINRVAAQPTKIVVASPGLGNEYSANTLRLRTQMPDLQLTSLTDAIGELYSWYQNRLDKIDKSRL